MEGFGPFDELTKDFTPERWARIEAMVAEMDEEDRQRAVGPGAATPGTREPEATRSVGAAAANRPGITERDGGRRGD